jgi:sulfur-oxidizing protein SoxA
MKLSAVCAALAALALGAGSPLAQAQKSAADAIAEYRASLQDGNPADLNAARGAALWRQARGPKNASLEKCDMGRGPGVTAGVAAQMPRYFADVKAVMDVESRLVHCMVELQGFSREAVTARPFSSDGQKATEIEDLVAFLYDESRDMPVAVPQAHALEKASYDRGKKIFYFRGGPYDFSCASCHSADNQRIRLQDLPNLTKKEPAQLAFTSWPAYRVSQGAVRTMQWRLYDCFRQQRFPELGYLSQASVDLITFLGVNANGGKMAAPAIKR